MESTNTAGQSNWRGIRVIRANSLAPPKPIPRNMKLAINMAPKMA